MPALIRNGGLTLQIRDAVVAMLDAWAGERGQVPVEKLVQPLLDVSVLAPKASPEAKVGFDKSKHGCISQICITAI